MHELNDKFAVYFFPKLEIYQSDIDEAQFGSTIPKKFNQEVFGVVVYFLIPILLLIVFFFLRSPKINEKLI